MNISLKSQNLPLLVMFTMVVGAVLWWTVRGEFQIADLLGLDTYYNSAVFVGICTLATLLIGELVPRQTKLRIVFWKWQNPAPGSQAFTVIAKNDHRIDLDVLERRYGPLPDSPTDQDILFFKIYKPFDSEISVKDAHKSFLLFREMSVTSLVAVILGTALCGFISGSLIPSGIFFAISSVSYFATSVAAQNAGRRFIANSLAVASVRPTPMFDG